MTRTSTVPDSVPAAFIDDLGWVKPSNHQIPGAVVTAKGPGWVVGRIRLPGGRMQTARHPHRAFRILVVVEGEIICTVNGRDVPVLAGQAIAMRASKEASVQSLQPWTKYEWLIRSNWVDEELQNSIPLQRGFVKLFTATTDAILDHPEIAQSPGAAVIWDVLASILAAMRAAVREVPLSLSPYRESQYKEAMQVIEDLHSDPEFTVEVLARKLTTSLSALHAVFRAAGTTPRRAIEERRVRDAIAHIRAQQTPPTRETMESIAITVGFGTLKKLRAAMSRYENQL